jgi:DNA-directed RNA polymerase alpha subunit
MSTVQDELWVNFSFKGPQSISLKSFDFPEGVVIANPEHQIATITSDGEFRGRFLSSKGRG